MLSVSARPTIAPAADVRAGRTSVRLQPSSPSAPTPALSSQLLDMLPVVSVRPVRTPASTSQPQPDRAPERQTLIVAQKRGSLPDLDPLPHQPATLQPTSPANPASLPATTRDLNGQFAVTSPTPLPAARVQTRRQRLAHSPRGPHHEDLTERQASEPNTSHRPRMTEVSQAPAFPSEPFSARVTHRRQHSSLTASRRIAPASELAQPASEQSAGGPRQLPVALPDNPSPRYPRRAISQRRQGVVILALRVDRDGRVSSATVNKSSGHSDLDQAALVAARAWKFRPARRGEMAVEITVLKPFRFIGRSR